MKIFEYLWPDNQVAQSIVYVLLAFFVVWFGLLLWSLWQNYHWRGQIKRCKDTSSLIEIRLSHLQQTDAPLQGSVATLSLPYEVERSFRLFERAKGLKEDGPISQHLLAIFDAGLRDGHLDTRGLIKNTTDRLFRANSLHRPLLSIFIILGLLGTLFGLADTLAALDTILPRGTQLNNDNLGLGLRQLLVSLKGAFAPSIWGVSLTVLGVLLFAAYQRFVALPLGNLLERFTLTAWVPQLVPTASQKLQEKLQLSRQQMERSVAAAQQVTEFADEFQHKTGSLRETLGLSNEALKRMAKIADGLGAFSSDFKEGVRALTPFQSDLSTLYNQMLNESRAFQGNVERNIAGSKEFQQHIQEQINSQHQQLARVLDALNSYEKAYIANREQIDEKLSAVLIKAELAFQSLSQRNEEIGQALDEALGRPLRETLTQNIGAMDSTLQARLSEVESSLRVHLSSLGERLRELDAPLNVAATKFTETFYNFNEHTDQWRTTLQREFANQNEISQQQLQRLETLSQNIPELLQHLSASSSNFSESSSSFAARGQQLSQDVSALSQSVASLSHSVDALSDQVIKNPDQADNRVLQLLAELAGILQDLTKRIERLSTAQPRVQQPSILAPKPRILQKPSWRDRAKSWLTFRKR